MFSKILIANRGEIACRIIETAQAMNIKTVAVYSDADQNARHMRLADEAYHIGAAASAESYLKQDVIIDTAKKAGAQAIHPGYGFLSENAEFVAKCEKAGLAFIGPSADSIKAMGLKDAAKDIMKKAGVPVVPGYQGDNQDEKFLQKQADEIGYPVLIKAVAGGGGKGMRLVTAAKDFAESLKSCQREAKAAFDNDHVLIEKYITSPRHVEVQVFGDSHGNAVHLFERDCSLQRRHQKVVEEAPAPGLRDDVRAALGEAAVKAVKALGYKNAGTIEFIMDSNTQEFFFMEMNTRLQVEHPVTEMITGQDLVAWQIRVAAGEALPLTQDEIECCGHAFEVRIYAEDAANDFLPQTGTVTHFSVDDDGNVRIDTAVEEGDEVTIHYDPMIAKLIAAGEDREAALETMAVALGNLALCGVKTNQEFLKNICEHEAFYEGKVHTGFIAEHEADLLPEAYNKPDAHDLALAAVYFLSEGWRDSFYEDDDPWATRDHWRMNMDLRRTLTLACGDETHEIKAVCKNDHYALTIDGKAYDVTVDRDGERYVSDFAIICNGQKLACVIVDDEADENRLFMARAGRTLSFARHKSYGLGEEGGQGRIIAPMPGKIIDVMVAKGDAVEKDQPLLIMEAMKMEMTIRAGCDGEIEELTVATNDQVTDGTLLVSIKNDEAAA